MRWRTPCFFARAMVLCGVLVVSLSIRAVRGEAQYECLVERLSARRLRVSLSINGYTARGVKDPAGGSRTAFHLLGAPNTMERGAPSLPYVTAVLPLPCRGATVRVQEAHFEALPLPPPLPSRGSVVAGSAEARVPLEDGAVYRDTVLWPRDVVAATPWGDAEKELRLAIHPFRYDPKRRSVLLARSIVVEVEAELGAQATPPRRGRGEGAKTSGGASTRGQMLVIYEKSFESALRDFLHFKRMTGLAVTAASYSPAGGAELGDTAAIARRIREEFGTEGANPRYVLFVGDFERLPSRDCIGLKHGGALSDWLYSPRSPRFGEGQVAFGRLPAASEEELKTMLDKVVRYELGDFQKASWLSRALGIASGELDLGYSGRSDAQHMEYLGGLLRRGGYAQVENMTDDAAGEKLVAADVVRAVNGGVGLVNYIGHGLHDGWKSSGFSTADARKLINRGMWPGVISAACDNGMHIGGQRSFAEAWLIARDGNAPTGAIAFTGATDNILWEEPMLAQEQMNMLLLLQGHPHQPLLAWGDIFTHGLIKMVEAYGRDKYLQQSADVWLLFGDPSLPVRSAAPSLPASQPLQLVPEGMRELPVPCDGEGCIATLCQRRKGVPPRYVCAVGYGGRALLSGLDVKEGDAVELATVRPNGMMQWVKNLPILPRQGRQLFAYSREKILEQPMQDALAPGGRLEMEVEVVNVSPIALGVSLPLNLHVEPSGSLELLPESSPLVLPPIGAGEALRAPLRFYFKVKEVRGIENVRILLRVGGFARPQLLVDRAIPYSAPPTDWQGQEAYALLIAPNPTAGKARVYLREGIASVRLFSQLGSCVLYCAGNGRQEVSVRTDGLANGIYFVVVESADGVRVDQRLVVIR